VRTNVPGTGDAAVPYDAPGRADRLPDELLRIWNEKINANHERLVVDGRLRTRFFSVDIGSFENPTIVTNVSWLGHPAEPTHCTGFDDATIRELSDWGFEGRQALQNEYCEYAVLQRPDSSGRVRPKRVQITTELREYWILLAVHDPDRLRDVASSTLGREIRWDELYGVGVNPAGLHETQRETRFATEVAGHGGDRTLIARGVPAQPTGALNRENALFMTHPINGLDDLIYIVLFGARHFAVRRSDGGLRPANVDEIFIDEGAAVLACRHADPRAATGAYDAVREGFKVAFANPLGMYLREDGLRHLTFKGQPLPPSWIRFGRGERGMRQRLELGPDDDDDAFLDDITSSDGQTSERLTGGHQIVSRMDIGPLIAAVATDPASEDEMKLVTEAEPVDCAATGICETVHELKTRFDAAHAPKPTARVPPGR
jgi:hypothetical protein